MCQGKSGKRTNTKEGYRKRKRAILKDEHLSSYTFKKFPRPVLRNHYALVIGPRLIVPPINAVRLR